MALVELCHLTVNNPTVLSELSDIAARAGSALSGETDLVCETDDGFTRRYD